MSKQVFLDYASCTPIEPSLLNTYQTLLEKYYINSEAVYDAGVSVHELVEKSRNMIARLLQVRAQDLLFCSGASEANSLAIKGYCLQNKNKGKHIITSEMEHSSVKESVKQLVEHFGFTLTYVPVYTDGKVRVEDIQKAITPQTILVSIMGVNNEIGSIQPIDEIGTLLKQYPQIKFHVDAVQSITKVKFNLENIDMMSITSHKLYGVKGCGILYAKSNVTLLALINGGQQEKSLVGGTLNAPACILFAKTLRLAMENASEHLSHMQTLHDYAREKLMELEHIVINSPIDACPSILNFSCTKVGSEIMMNALNAKHICVSSQSTCSSRMKKPSHTLVAMRLEDAITYGAIRISFSHLTTINELDYFIESVKEIVYEYKTR